MEKSILIMIVIVAIVAIGGLLYIGLDSAPQLIPVFVEGPSVDSPAPGTVLGKAGGQIKFSVAPASDSVTGQIRFSFKE
jgi:hypothetical protein